MSVLRTYGVAAAVTLAIWGAVAVGMGWAGLLSVVVLTVLEITFSFDNAVVNSRLVSRMSAGWQRAFMTVGILVAVFVVRFALPIAIVAVTAGLGFGEVVQLAIHHPQTYAQHLQAAGPMIDAFGGTFLAMIAVGFFLDGEKDVHWIGWLERRLAPLGRYDNIGIFVMVIVAVVLALTVDGGPGMRLAVLVAAACGIALHVGLDIFAAVFDSDSDNDGVDGGQYGGAGGGAASPTRHRAGPTVLVGAAAAVLFLRLEMLDASFSFDGVIGAFAITTSVVLIMPGLGAGALWVRSMTVHLVRAGTLAKYRYLEHGAHWAIAALAVVMLVKLYGLDAPDWATGSLGLVFIAAAVASSVVHRRRHVPQPAQAPLTAVR